MKRAAPLSTLLLILVLSSASATAAAPADVTGRHFLANGLDVRLLPSPSSPLRATLVLVRTGYALEEPVNLGYSHLLEHLVFAGTKKMDKEALFDEVERMGAYLNGYTRDDYMGYLMVGHRDHFGRQMELLSEILFRAALKEKAVTEAKEVVLEEIRRRRSRPDTREDETFQSLLYESSSYARTGLGNEKTVAAVSSRELREHYRRVYRPDNMILLSAGAMEDGEVLAVLERTFGAAEAGGRPARPDPPPPLRGRRSYLLETEMPDLRVRVGLNGPDPRSVDAERLELLGAVLGGAGGRLQRALENAGLDPRSVGAGLSVNDGFSRFVVTAGFAAGADPEEALGVLLRELEAVASGGLAADEVDEAREALRADAIMGREKLHYYLMGIAPWVIAGAPGQGLSERRWDGIDASALASAAGEYLAGAPYAALLTVPAGRTGDGAGEAPAERKKALLDNGLVVVAEHRPGSRVFALNLLTRRRSASEPAGRAGIADFLHRVVTGGTADRSKEQIESDLRDMGASLATAGNPTLPFGDFYTSRSYSFIRAESLLEEGPRLVDLVGDLVKNASFPEEEVEEVRSRMLDYITFRDAKPDTLAGRILAGELYGPRPFGRPILGSEDSVRSVTREDLRRFRDGYFTGRNLVVSVVGGLPPEEAVELVREHFSALPPGETPPPVLLTARVNPTVVERQLGRPQGAVMAGAVGAAVPPGQIPALSVVTGLLNDRLDKQLREKEGLAYSVGASLGSVDGTAVFSFSIGTAPSKIEKAREGIRREIERLRRRKFTTREIEGRVNAITGRLQMRMLSALNRGFYLALAETKGLVHTYGEDYRRMLLALTPEKVQAAAAAHLPVALTEVVVR